MYFNSLHFLFFFPIVVGLYFVIPHKYRWGLLLIASYYFYMSWKAEYVILIIISTLVDYFAGLEIYKSKGQKRKKIFLGLSLFVNLGLLFTFKYFNFFSESFRLLLGHFTIQLHPTTLKLLLPVGISFYTFQTLSYTIDVYRKKIKPEKHLGIFAVYVSFFPQLVAGPIERAKHLLPQFYKKAYFNYQRVTDGLKLMLWGFFLKLVIADRLAIIVDTVYNNVGDYSSTPLALATVFFAFQIYCDFAGYSFIAIGSAQVMGFDLMDNFKRPYFSKSIAEFWKRWHISLYSWFVDYIYIPLGGSRVSKIKHYRNIFIVFMISGLWHGASITFILWGALHGFYLIVGDFTKNIRKKIAVYFKVTNFPKIYLLFQVIITFVLVDLSWIFFRANSLEDAIYIYKNIFLNFTLTFTGEIGATWTELIIAFCAIGFMEFIHLIQERTRMRRFLSKKPLLYRWILYLFIILLILLFGDFNQSSFLYFQF